MSNIDQLAENFKTLKELKQYCNSQYSVITSLNQKIVRLEEENKNLKDMLSKSTPIVQDSGGGLEIHQNISDELAVCLMQIKMLRDRCAGGFTELTFEEAKKLDIYTKLLIQLRDGKKASEDATKSLSDDELLKFLNEDLSKHNG